MSDTITKNKQEASEQLASSASTEVVIDLDNVNKWYGEFHVLKDKGNNHQNL